MAKNYVGPPAPFHNGAGVTAEPAASLAFYWAAVARAFIRLVNREIFREAFFLWIVPLTAARLNMELASFRVARKASKSLFCSMAT
jgi:hypothetical protein